MDIVLISLGYIPRGVFNLLRNCQNVFQSSCTILHSYQQVIRVQLHHAAAVAAAKLPQSCPTLCDPRDGSPAGSPVPGILQARTLEWVAISFSNA